MRHRLSLPETVERREEKKRRRREKRAEEAVVEAEPSLWIRGLA